MEGLTGKTNFSRGDSMAAKLGAKENLISRLMRLSHCPGISVAVLYENDVVLCRGYGHADVTKNVPAAADTVYPIASVSKAFAAAACGILVEEGHLSWDDTIVSHIPEFAPIYAPEVARKITFVDVLCHRSGLRDQPCLHQGPNGLPLFDDAATLISVINSLPSEDGAFRHIWQYSPLPYALTGLLVEKKTGQSLAEFLQSRIFRPLGMQSTSVAGQLAAAPPSFLAQPYTAMASGQLIPRNVSPKAYQFPVNAAMGIWSSAADMAQWARTIIASYKSSFGDKGLAESSSQTLPQMAIIFHRWCPLPSGPAGAPAYCLGWFSTHGYHISDDIFDPEDGTGRILPLPVPPHRQPPQTILFHSGTGNGCTSSLSIFPDTSSAVVVLANSSLCGDATDPVALVLSAALRGYEVDEEAILRSVAANAAWDTGRWFSVREDLDRLRATVETEDRPLRAEQIVGVYRNDMGLTILIESCTRIEEDQGLSIYFGLSDAQLPLRPFCANTMCFLPDEYNFQALGMGYMACGRQFLIHLHFSESEQRVVGIWWQHDPTVDGTWFSLHEGVV